MPFRSQNRFHRGVVGDAVIGVPLLRPRVSLHESTVTRILAFRGSRVLDNCHPRVLVIRGKEKKERLNSRPSLRPDSRLTDNRIRPSLFRGEGKRESRNETTLLLPRGAEFSPEIFPSPSMNPSAGMESISSRQFFSLPSPPVLVESVHGSGETLQGSRQ